MIDLCSDYLELRGLRNAVLDSLSKPYREAYHKISAIGKPTKGTVIAKLLGVLIDTFRKHYVKALRPFGLKNDGDGYFIESR